MYKRAHARMTGVPGRGLHMVLDPAALPAQPGYAGYCTKSRAHGASTPSHLSASPPARRQSPAARKPEAQLVTMH